MRARHREGRPSLEVYKKLSHHAHDFLSAAGKRLRRHCRTEHAPCRAYIEAILSLSGHQ
jgi:hypothetical protein